MPDQAQLLSDYLVFYRNLTAAEQNLLSRTLRKAEFEKGAVLADVSSQCNGMMLVFSGQIRAFMMSREGKEITLYRLLPRDVCVMTSSCLIRNLNISISMEFEKDSVVYFIPPDVLGKLKAENSKVEHFVLEIMSQRFSEVLWVMEKVIFTPMLTRLCEFLLERSALEENDVLTVTHSEIAAKRKRDCPKARRHPR